MWRCPGVIRDISAFNREPDRPPQSSSAMVWDVTEQWTCTYAPFGTAESPVRILRGPAMKLHVHMSVSEGLNRRHPHLVLTSPSVVWAWQTAAPPAGDSKPVLNNWGRKMRCPPPPFEGGWT